VPLIDLDPQANASAVPWHDGDRGPESLLRRSHFEEGQRSLAESKSSRHPSNACMSSPLNLIWPVG